MCGRYSFFTPIDQAEALLDVQTVPHVDWQAQYNAAPGSWMPVITNEFSQVLQFYRWGLVPQWARDDKMGYGMNNTRAESIKEKPSFANIFKYKRCIAVADGWYEWASLPGIPVPGRKKAAPIKQPYRFHRPENGLLLFAGLWDVWGDGLYSYSIITVDSNDDTRDIHHRMPLLLTREEASAWLKKGTADAGLEKLLRTPAPGWVEKYPVSTKLNVASINEPELIEVATLPKPPPGLFD
jgi:putative SOS response-associated peptidase YedK